MISKLFTLLSYSNDYILSNLRLINLELERATSSAKMYFEADKPLSTNELREFCDILDERLIPGLREQTYSFSILSYDDEDIEYYYKFIIQRLAKNASRLVQSLGYDHKASEHVLTIKVPGEDSTFTLSKNNILNEYKRFGFSDIDIKLEILDKEEKIDIREAIKRENKEIVMEAKKTTDAAEEWIQMNKDRDLIGKAVSLKELPDNEEELEIYRANQRTWGFIITGYIEFFDADAFEKRNSVKLVVGDGESFVYCTKRRMSNNEEGKYFSKIKVGQEVRIQCFPELNNFTGDVTMHIVNMQRKDDIKPITTREDLEPVKRVELHLHTKMSALDGVPEMTQYIEAAKIFGHRAIAITDHYSVQSYHDLHEYAGKHPDFKALYGLELSYVDEDQIRIAHDEQDIDLESATFVVFDVETTGFSVNYERLIQISGTKVQNGMFVGDFDELVNPEKNVPSKIVNLTGITNADVQNALDRRTVLERFLEFTKGCILVAHNSPFDMGHLYKNLDDLGMEHPIFPVIDTLVLAKALFPNHKSYGLDKLSKFFGVTLDKHHQADQDAKATAEVFLHLIEETKKRGIKYHSEINSLLSEGDKFKVPIPKHINLLASNQKGLINLYHILSLASTDYFAKDPIVTKKVLEQYREGILVGSGCRNSQFFVTMFDKDEKDAEKMIDFYDYIEVQPQNTFDYYKNNMDDHVYCYQDTIKRIIRLAKKHNIPVVATGDCHQVNKEDLIFRQILVGTDQVGGGKHPMRYEKEIPSEYYMTTREMLDEFSFLGEDTAYEIVVTNTNLIADACENVKAFTNTPYPPTDDFMKARGIPSAEEYVNNCVYNKAKEMYGETLPEIVVDRLKNELDNINKNKFSTIYLISQQLVFKSRSDGYVVGSRGSVGSSVVAHMMSITEVNSLPPHYRCPKCHFSSFKMTDEQKQKYGIRKDEEELQPILENVFSGYDLPHKPCPVCGTDLERDGHDIPFETFLGVPEDPKTPDIDLNFSGENQGQIHNYIRELFGETKAFRAGTILTCKDKTAYAVVRDYFDDVAERDIKQGLEPTHHRKAEIEALSNQINGSKKTSSQHPGGIVVVPYDHEIYEVTPYQYPGDSTDRSWKTTHFDYHSFEKNLFKLDVLGHDDPTVIKYLMKFVKQKPDHFPFDDALNIPVNDATIYQMMNDTKVLGISPDDIDSPVATFGISEFGTSFVRGMLEKARPKTFAELVKVSGLSHGTDVWSNNAEALIDGSAKGFPKQAFKDIIGCRDDIMLDLISFGVPQDFAFQVMEFVRKGKPSKDEEKWAKHVERLRSYNVPEWYIWSCGKIKYMFPKAHATAYVVMALRIAWFKVYRPIFFYSAILSKKMVQYDIQTMIGGVPTIKAELKRLKELPQNERKAKEEDLITTLELSLEMCARGFKFNNVDLYNSEALDFAVSDDEKSLYMPFSAVDSLGGAVAQSIVDARQEKPFSTKVDFMNRTMVSKTLLKRMEDLGVFEGIPDDNQMTLDLGI